MRQPCLLLFSCWLLSAICPANAQADFISGTVAIQPDPIEKTVPGSVTYLFRVPGDVDSVRLDAREMEVLGFRLNGAPEPFQYDGRQLSFAAPRGTRNHTLEVRYLARPRQTVYFIGWDAPGKVENQIWTQGQGKYTSHWVPSFDDMQEKVVFDLEITAGLDFSVVANGKLKQVTRTDSLKRWVYDMEQPMSSYLLAFAIGRFDSLRLESSGGVPIFLYYPPGRRSEADITYGNTRELFDYLENEIGVPYPWQNYKQVPVRDFLYAGMENTGATFFSQTYLTDSLGNTDRSYLNVNAHELAHQWFGNLVTETDGGQHWLHEGFATYYAYLAEGHLQGPEHMHWTLYRTANALRQTDQSGGAASLLDPGAGSLTFYERGAWALFILRDLLGDTAFREGIRIFLETYSFDNATVPQFLRIMETAGAADLGDFRVRWLEAEAFPFEEAMDYLRTAEPSISYYLDFVRDSGDVPSQTALEDAWEAFEAVAYRTALITRYAPVFESRMQEAALSDKRPEIRKALLGSLPGTEEWMLPWLEEMLDARSYEIREAALYRLWSENPGQRKHYLDQVKENGSLESPMLRQMWWVLALVTRDYASPLEAATYLTDLRNTTRPGLDHAIRENGFQLLRQLDALDEGNLKDLLGATEHHSWQFRLFARRLLDDLMEARPERAIWEALAGDLPRQKFPYVYDKIEDL